MMSWFSNLFSSSTADSRRNSFMSTQEAFSVSSNFSRAPGSYARYAGSTTDVATTAGTSYAYPPPSNDAYDYVPTTATSARGSRQPSLLPLYNTPSASRQTYPPLGRTWSRIRIWLSNEYPELGDTLNWGIQPQDLADAEQILGQALPQVVRESYLTVDGQEAESSAGCAEGLFFGLTLLPLEDVVEEWRFWREVDDDPSTGANSKLKEVMQSIPTGWVRHEYSQRGWIPLVTDKTGNYLGIDLNPDEGGSVGQVIVFGRDFDTKVVMYRGQGSEGWAKWLASFVDELESGEGYELGSGQDGTDGSEDSIGYESYFFDGTGRSKGEGGGDAGVAGLRLTGEYRGWSVLEAWADRSVKLWREAGVLPASPPMSPTEPSNKVGLGVINVADGRSGFGAEVPIPLVAEVPTATVEESERVSDASNRRPTVSVSKPPVYPVDLPTPSQILPSTPVLSFDRDLERGTPFMDNVDHPLRNDTFPLQSQNDTQMDTSPVEEATLVSLPSSQDVSNLQNPIPASEVLDLLQNDAQDMKVMSTEPVLSPHERQASANPSSLNNFSASPNSALSETIYTPESEVGQPDPDATIRLVNGNGIAGIVVNGKSSKFTTSERDADLLNDLPDVSSESFHLPISPTSPTVQKSVSKHEKRKSLSSGLKMFRQSSKQKSGRDSLAF